MKQDVAGRISAELSYCTICVGADVEAQSPCRRNVEGGDHTFIDQNQAEVISGGVFLVDFSEGWCQVEAAEEETDRYRFTS